MVKATADGVGWAQGPESFGFHMQKYTFNVK